MYVGEFLEVILKEHEIDPTNYNEAMSNTNAHISKIAMEVELEFM